MNVRAAQGSRCSLRLNPRGARGPHRAAHVRARAATGGTVILTDATGPPPPPRDGTNNGNGGGGGGGATPLHRSSHAETGLHTAGHAAAVAQQHLVQAPQGAEPACDVAYASRSCTCADEDGPHAEIGAMLAAAGRTVESLPPDMQMAYNAGQLSKSAVQRFLSLESNWFFKIFMPLQGFRERLMADPSFFVKVGIECGIGIGTKCAAEAEKRKGRFAKELDFVTANVIMAIIADFMLVWLPAPTMSFATAQSCRVPRNAMARFFSCCPDNAFQKVPEGFPSWSLAQRVAAPIRNGGKLLVVGFSASMFGVLITNLLCWVREQVSGGCQQSNPQNPLTVSAAYATYMATSSNMRYQVVAGVLEERGIETIFAGKSSLCHALSVVLRTANTFLGSLWWVDFVRLVGLQPKGEADDKKKGH